MGEIGGGVGFVGVFGETAADGLDIIRPGPVVDADFVLDDIQGTLFDFFVDSADVFAEDSDADELDAAKEEDADDSGGEAGDFFSPGEEGDDVEETQAEGGDGDEEAEIGCGAKGLEAEADHAVHRIANQLSQSLLGFAVGAFLAVVEDAGLLEAQPASQAGDETVAFGELVEFIDDAAIHQAEDAGIGCAGQIGDAAEDRIEKAKADAACAGFAARLALSEDDLAALLPGVDHVRDHFGRVLKIAVDKDDAIAARVVDAGGDGGLVAEVSGEIENFDAWIFSVNLPKHFERAVAAAVVDANQFPRIADGIQGGGHPLAKLGKIVFLVEDGDDDGDHVGHDKRWEGNKIGLGNDQ